MLESILQWDRQRNDETAIFSSNCKGSHNLDTVDFNKPGILIIDDNEGICSFIKDDLEELSDDGVFDIDKYNIFVFHGNMCAYELLNTIQQYPKINIQKAIIDITYGGTVQTKNGNIKLNGVDVFEVLYELNPELKYLFYTGNQMNSHIKIIGGLMRKYTTLTGKMITNKMLFKTQFSMKDRRTHIAKLLF